jgi:hypothetical protein
MDLDDFQTELHQRFRAKLESFAEEGFMRSGEPEGPAWPEV